MGLAVAYQLATDGFKPVVYEADNRVGGMTASFDFGGLLIERYYHFHCTSDLAFFEMLKELGIEHKLHWTKTKMGYWFGGHLQDWGNPIALLKFKGLDMASKFRYGLHAFISAKRKNWQSLDKESAIPWIKKWVGERAYQVLWEPLFLYKFYELSDCLSAAWIWSRIRRIGNSRYSIFEEKLGYLEGGSDTLLAALEQKIKDLGGEIRLQSPISEIVIEGDKVKGLIVNGDHDFYDQVISTIPIQLVPKIAPQLPAKILDQYRAIKNIAVVCVIAKLKKSVSPNFWVNINDSEIQIPGVIEYSNLRPLNDTIIYAPFYMPQNHADYKLSDTEFCNRLTKCIKKLNTNITDDDFIEIRVSRYQFAQPVCEPGHLDRLPPIHPNIEGLTIADTSYYYPEDRGISESIGFGRSLARRI